MTNLRQTAIKVWLSNLYKGDYQKTLGEFEPNYVSLGDVNISRVNLIGIIVDKSLNEDGSYGFFVLDDGSTNMQLKFWRDNISLMDDVEIGNVVLVIGKVRDLNGGLYISPEILRVMNSSWLKLRKIELFRKYGEPVKVEFKEEIPPREIVDDVVEEMVVERGLDGRGVILDLVNDLDKGDGVDIEEIVGISKLIREDAEKVVSELLKEGEIFESKPGKLRCMF